MRNGPLPFNYASRLLCYALAFHIAIGFNSFLIAPNAAADIDLVSSSLGGIAAAKRVNSSCDCPDPKAKDRWNFTAAFGFNLARGNTDSLLTTLTLNAQKERDQNIYFYNLDGAYGELENEKNQAYVRGDAEYKRLLDERVYLGFGSSVLTDEIVDLDYRTFLSPLAGYFLVKEENVKLNFDIGPSYVFEKQGGETSNFLAARVANRFEWKFSQTGKLFQTLEFLMSTEDTKEWLLNSEAGVEATLTSQLGLVVSIRDRYDNQPGDDRLKNDVFVVTALKASY